MEAVKVDPKRNKPAMMHDGAFLCGSCVKSHSEEINSEAAETNPKARVKEWAMVGYCGDLIPAEPGSVLKHYVINKPRKHEDACAHCGLVF